MSHRHRAEWKLTTIKFVTGFWAIDMAIAALLHRDAGTVLARKLTRRTLGPHFFCFVFIFRIWEFELFL